ncbi:hypothetical protein AWE51_24685 [Aquimarina aggregata]|uniref:Uncharacterized protein n=1 Tax=Aquimarina aggregata TaxID=1642818 RepID=A0A163AXI1_9FLAO|nr:DUF6695 family protein [Aquimarina aggregata]KZS40873.1 hypothetical protein AWE51_24685 [Aquimarina aggregata]
MNYTGKIISLAFPDTFVKHSDESSTKVLLALGMGKHNYIKAGHAALVLIENKTGLAEYYDFGRYITPPGFGRVRSAVTDVELEIPFKAIIDSEGSLSNIEDFLIWLERHPEKTHGSGRMIASVCDYVDYTGAKEFVIGMHAKGSIPYKAFGKDGSNCSRIVTDTILAGTDNIKIKKPLLRNKKFTPSPLGNVEKAAANNPIYQVINGEIKMYVGSVLKENLTNYFDKNIPKPSEENLKDLPEFLKDAHFLSGTGSCAYFNIEATEQEMVFEIKRYTQDGLEDFRGLFKTQEMFDIRQEHKFVYDSNCLYCHIQQQGRKIRFDLIKRIIN